MRVPYYKGYDRDTVTYVSNEKYQTLREAVNALLHSEQVDLPRCEDSAFEFDSCPSGVPDDFTDTRFDRMEAAATVARKPNREKAHVSEQVKPETPETPETTPSDGQ